MKPTLVCHMSISIDGNILIEHWSPTPSLGPHQQHDLYADRLSQFGVRGYIVGRASMTDAATAAARVSSASDVAPDRTMHLADGHEGKLAIVVDTKGRLHWGTSTFHGDHLMIALGSDVSDNHLLELVERGISYLVAPNREIDPAWLVETLGDVVGATKLGLVGGAVMNSAFFNAGLVDQISLILVPALTSRNAIKPFFEPGPQSANSDLSLTLNKSEVHDGGLIHLVYDVTH